MEESKNLEQNLDKSNEKLHISDVMCSLPISVVKDLVKAYWWSSSEMKTSQGIPKQIQIILDEVKRVTGEEFDWYENGTW
jgi:RecB family endonuclease NucS